MDGQDLGHKGTLEQETAFSLEDKGKGRHRVPGVVQGSHDLEYTVEGPVRRDET